MRKILRGDRVILRERRIGFKQEGIQEQGYFYRNEYSDFVMMRILRGEWEQRTGKDPEPERG